MSRRTIELSGESIRLIDDIRANKNISTSEVVNEIILAHMTQQNLLKKIDYNLDQINKMLGIKQNYFEFKNNVVSNDKNKKVSGFKIDLQTKELIKINADNLGVNNSEFIEKLVSDYCSKKDYKLAVSKIEAQVHILTSVISDIEVDDFKVKVENYNKKRFGKYKGW